MELHSRVYAAQAREDFTRAQRKAFLSNVSSFMSRQPNMLLSFDDVRQQLPIKSETYRGIQTVAVNEIIGSVDRYHDFNRDFLPRQTHTRPRWESVDVAALSDIILPPIQVYKVGGAYFVKDGNHRVSVAKEKGMEYIDAEVIECETTVPLSPDTDPRDLLRLAEYARFLEQTNLDRLRPGCRIDFTTLGRYDTLIEHISAHRWYMGIEQNRPISWEEAVLDWFDHLYLPLVKMIEEQGIMGEFPNHTPSDLYLWIMDHRYYLSLEQGSPVGFQTAVLSYDSNQVSWARKVWRWTNRMFDYMAQPFVISMSAISRALKVGSEDTVSEVQDEQAPSDAHPVS